MTSYYLPTVLIQSVGLDEKLARLLAACNSVSYLAFSMIGIPNVEVRPDTLVNQDCLIDVQSSVGVAVR